MANKNSDEIRQVVQKQYGKIAKSVSQIQEVAPNNPCCGGTHISSHEVSRTLGYSNQEIASVPQGANLGLGCGNPSAIASLKPGESVLDLGSGAGFDCFLAAQEVGETGKVIGVDMTPEMLRKARENASKIDANNIEFRLGEIEHLPVADESIDVIMSNCVINLSPDKPQVFKESFRVLKPGGRLAISDIVSTASLPEDVRNDLSLIAGCIGGAESIENIERILQDVGFKDIKIQPKDESKTFIRKWMPDMKLEDYIVSATIEAIKPANVKN
jgi:SAM-dependent methyltransferase